MLGLIHQIQMKKKLQKYYNKRSSFDKNKGKLNFLTFVIKNVKTQYK